VAQHENLELLAAIATHNEHEQLQQPADDEVED
jgi:hypothetical protein